MTIQNTDAAAPALDPSDIRGAMSTKPIRSGRGLRVGSRRRLGLIAAGLGGACVVGVGIGFGVSLFLGGQTKRPVIVRVGPVDMPEIRDGVPDLVRKAPVRTVAISPPSPPAPSVQPAGQPTDRPAPDLPTEGLVAPGPAQPASSAKQGTAATPSPSVMSAPPAAPRPAVSIDTAAAPSSRDPVVAGSFSPPGPLVSAEPAPLPAATAPPAVPVPRPVSPGPVAVPVSAEASPTPAQPAPLAETRAPVLPRPAPLPPIRAGRRPADVERVATVRPRSAPTETAAIPLSPPRQTPPPASEDEIDVLGLKLPSASATGRKLREGASSLLDAVTNPF